MFVGPSTCHGLLRSLPQGSVGTMKFSCFRGVRFTGDDDESDGMQAVFVDMTILALQLMLHCDFALVRERLTLLEGEMNVVVSAFVGQLEGQL